MSMDEKLKSLQRADRLVQPTHETKSHAYIKDYEAQYAHSIADPETFWNSVAKELDWFTPWNKVLDWIPPSSPSVERRRTHAAAATKSGRDLRRNVRRVRCHAGAV